MFTTWALLGLFRGERGFAGALFEPDYTIQNFESGGPLDEAGFEVGDSVVMVEGIPVEELGMYSRWPRSLSRGPGESVRMGVVRGGEIVSGDVVYRATPSSVMSMRFGAVGIMLSFMVFGLWAYMSVRTEHALRLAYIGLATAAAIPGPDVGAWRGVASHVQVLAIVLWSILMMRFFVLFPNPKRMGTGRLFTSGRSLVVLGVVVAVAMTLVGFLDVVPGSAYFPLSMSAIPLSMALAVRRHSRQRSRASP